MNPTNLVRIATALLLSTPLLQGCNAPQAASQTSPQENSREVEIEIGEDRNAALNASQKLLALLFIQEVQAQVSDIKLCIEKLRFKKAEAGAHHPDGATHSRGAIEDSLGHDGPNHDTGDDNAEDTIEFNIGLISMDDSGAKLGKLNLPVGDYRRVEIELSPSCLQPSGQGGATNHDFVPSIDLVNDNGRFQSQSKIKFRFDGNFQVAEESLMPQKIALIFSDLKKDLDSVTSDAQLEQLNEKRTYTLRKHQ